MDVDEAEVLLPALDCAEVGAIEAGSEGQVFLGEVPGLAELADARAEALFDPLLLRLVHAQLVGKLWTISLWTMIHICGEDSAFSVQCRSGSVAVSTSRM